MSSSHSDQLYATEAFQAFGRWLKENYKSTGNPADGQFLPFDLLEEHLESNDFAVLNNLLSAIYPSPAAPISAKAVISGYSKIFCILFCIDKIYYLEVFMRCENLGDSQLPFKLDEPPRDFPFSPKDPGFLEHFCNAQWTFCPPRVDDNWGHELDQRRILPFTKKIDTGRGTSATISMIEIYPYYNSLRSLPNEPNGPWAKFALKTYHGKDGEKSWNNEKHAFQQLRESPSPHVIGFYSAFKHGSTCHAILEYADRGSLEQYLKANPPPQDGVDIARFWTRSLELIVGLKDLHNGIEIILHQDVKPANILVISDPGIESPYACKFKIADLGSSRSKRIISPEDDRSIRGAQGTRTYGAPECYRSDGTFGEGSIRVESIVDVFSLGAVLSELTVWIAGGYDYLIEYRQDRRKAIEQIPDFHDGDCFHNGSSMLPIVGDWHKKVQSKINYNLDVFTPKLIPLIEQMLQDARRDNAMSFCTKAHKLLVECLEEFGKLWPDIAIPDDILLSSLQRQRQRTDPPVRPSDIYQHASTSLVAARSTLTSRGNIYSPEPILDDSIVSSPGPTPNSLRELVLPSRPASFPAREENLIGFHAPQFHSNSDRNRHTTSAPIEASNPSDIVDPEVRRHTGQLHDPRMPGRQMSLSDGIGSVASPLTSKANNKISNNGLRISTNFRDLGGRITNQSQAANPYSLSSAARPSTGLPLKLPPMPGPANHLTNGMINRITPFMSRKEAMEWRERRKSRPRESVTLRDSWVLKFLDDRDSVIIIDDSQSMLEHWENMTELLGIFAYMIKVHDKDGLDLYFATSADKRNEKTSSKLVKIVEKRRGSGDLGYTDMSVRLEQVLGDYTSKIQREAKMAVRTRGLNVYIFTDAVWTPLCDIVPSIDRMVKTLTTYHLPEKQVGLQFISFGNNPDGLARLRLVDNCLVSKPEFPHDIVDTTPSSGSLFKIICGAIDRNFDFDSLDPQGVH